MTAVAIPREVRAAALLELRRRRTVATPAAVLRGAACPVYDSSARNRVWVAGRRSGKTREAILECIRGAATPKSEWRYIAPTRDMAKELAWIALKESLPRELVATTNETELSQRLVNGSHIRLLSADHPDSLRGPGLDGAVFDECRDIDAYCWKGVIRPALADRKGRALFISSPNGYDWTYDLFLKGQEDPTGEWASWQTTTLEGGWVSVEEIEKARQDMDPRLFRQEFLATFETMEGRVYHAFLRKPYPAGNLDRDARDDGVSPVLVGMDFNVNPMSFVLGTAAGDQLLIWDAVELPTSNTEEVALYLRHRFGNRQITVCPDPSGNARKTSAPTGQTDFTILKSQAMYVDASSAAPAVRDRVNNTNANLCAGEGVAAKRRLRINPSCIPLIRALEGLTYNASGNNQPDKGSGLDHITDALGYLLWQRFNLLSSRRATVHAVLT